MWKPIVAVSVGGTLGSLLRWWFGMTLNALFPTLPPGTLTANLVGGYIVGVAVAFFGTYTAIGMAAIRDHRLLRRAHDLLDVFRGDHCTSAARTSVLGARCGGDSSGGIHPHDLRRHRHLHVAEGLIKNPPAARATGGFITRTGARLQSQIRQERGGEPQAARLTIAIAGR